MIRNGSKRVHDEVELVPRVLRQSEHVPRAVAHLQVRAKAKAGHVRQ